MNFIVLKTMSPSASRFKGSKDNKNLKMTQSCRTASYLHLSLFMVGVSFIRLDRKQLIIEQFIFLLVPQKHPEYRRCVEHSSIVGAIRFQHYSNNCKTPHNLPKKKHYYSLLFIGDAIVFHDMKEHEWSGVIAPFILYFCTRRN